METLLLLLPLLEKYDGKIWVDVIEVIIPPGFDGTFQSLTPAGKSTIVLGFTVSDFYEYDPVNDELITPVSTTDAGIYRDATHFKWNFIPFTQSIARKFLPDFSISHKGSECVYRIVNNSSIYIYSTVAVYLLEFDRQYEDKIREYLRKIADLIERGGA